MLTLYHLPLSFNSRRVWVALLEKELAFETVVMELGGDQFAPHFLSLNPFHHIPVLTDGDFRVLESLAILDYLEAKYPTPSLLPKDPEVLAKVRMVEMVTINELVPALGPLFRHSLGASPLEPRQETECLNKIRTTLNFLAGLLEDKTYFGGDQLTLAEVVAGTVIPLLDRPGLNLGGTLDSHSYLKAWSEHLEGRPAWQATRAKDEDFVAFGERLRARLGATKA